jgi:hypothetical protein
MLLVAWMFEIPQMVGICFIVLLSEGIYCTATLCSQQTFLINNLISKFAVAQGELHATQLA